MPVPHKWAQACIGLVDPLGNDRQMHLISGAVLFYQIKLKADKSGRAAISGKLQMHFPTGSWADKINDCGHEEKVHP